MKIKKPCLMLLLITGIMLTGCSGDKQGQGKGKEGKTATKQPATSGSSAKQPAMIKPSAEMVARGSKLYKQNCQFCHQPDAIGKPGVAPSLTNQEFLKYASDKFIKGTIRDGRAGTGMPPFAHLGRSGIEAILAFLRSHAKTPNISASVDAQPESHGDPRLGRQWFNQVCLSCHGTHGDGYARGGTGTAIGKAGFLGKASDGFIRMTIKKGRSNTRMLGFTGPEAMANLSDREIDDIIAYLRTVPSK